MKYRILQKDDKYYPQTKTFLFWRYVFQWNVECIKIECWSYQEALDVLKGIKQPSEKAPPIIKVHEVDL